MTLALKVYMMLYFLPGTNVICLCKTFWSLLLIFSSLFLIPSLTTWYPAAHEPYSWGFRLGYPHSIQASVVPILLLSTFLLKMACYNRPFLIVLFLCVFVEDVGFFNFNTCVFVCTCGYLCVYVCVWVCVCACSSQHTRGGYGRNSVSVVVFCLVWDMVSCSHMGTPVQVNYELSENHLYLSSVSLKVQYKYKCMVPCPNLCGSWGDTPSPSYLCDKCFLYPLSHLPSPEMLDIFICSFH